MFTMYKSQIDKLLSLKEGEHLEIFEKGYESFRQVLNKYLRVYPLPNEISIKSIQVSKNYRWYFRVDLTK